MKLIIIFGAGAVGKMTVGQELAKITDLRLYHGHMCIEMVIEIFGRRVSKVDARIREIIFEEFAKSDLYGLIFTFMWSLDQQSSWDNIGHLVDVFRREGAEICGCPAGNKASAKCHRKQASQQGFKKKYRMVKLKFAARG